MRVTVACAGCRLKKIKCVHKGRAPCQNCQTRDGSDECRLFTTQEFRKYKRANTVLLKIDSGKLELSESLVNTCIEITVQNHPELVFLYFPPNINLFRLLDPVVCLGLCALSSPYLEKSPENSEFIAAFEAKLLEKLDDKASMDYLVLLQASVIWLLLNWQTGKTHKGYLFGGFADRVYTTLTNQKSTSGSLIEQEFYIRSIWAYQLTVAGGAAGAQGEVFAVEPRGPFFSRRRNYFLLPASGDTYFQDPDSPQLLPVCAARPDRSQGAAAAAERAL
ncbi:hypothetical protein KL943_004601 [Ogataea angusta]|nr:hypothetical protein KL943_004601 [Ogataea angusta]